MEDADVYAISVEVAPRFLDVKRHPQARFTQERAIGEADAVVHAIAAHALARVQGPD